jgi:hypothetical protein
MTNAHILIVTPDRDDPTDEGLFTYEIECPGVTDACRRYEDCSAGEDEREELEAAEDSGRRPAVAHGKRHFMFDGVWCAETDHCNVVGHDGLDNDVAGRFTPGRHPVDFDFGDGTEIVILPLGEQELVTTGSKPGGGVR